MSLEPNAPRPAAVNARWAWTLIAPVVLVGGAGCYDNVVQPIAFSHKVHVDQEIECENCHKHFKTAEYSGLPRLEVCAECHEESVGETDEEKKIVAAVAKGDEIEWQRVYVLPDHVFYTHRTHVVTAKVDCKTCHGDIAALDQPPSHPLVDQSMTWCLSCHEDSSATTDCIHCHR